MYKNNPSRRKFLKGGLATAATLGISTLSAKSMNSKPEKLTWSPKISENIADLSDSTLRWMKQLGMNHVVFQGISGIDLDNKKYWTYEDVMRAKKQCEKFEMELSSMLIPIEWYPKSCLDQKGRDEEIERVIKCINAAGEAGIPVLEWRLFPDFFWDERVGYSRVDGRGGAKCTNFNYDRIKDKPPFEGIGIVSAKEMWDRTLYFAKPIIEAAEKAGIKMSCHPNDPPVPDMRGCARIQTSIEGVQRLLDEIPSPANGITFCQGTYTEMGVNVIDAIRHFGKQMKIFHVHLRAVRGKVPNYTEVFMDEGDIDMFEALKTYWEVGYTGTIVSDHTPRVESDTPFGHIGRSYSHGYIRAMVQLINKST